jgi:hypothetical protein
MRIKRIERTTIDSEYFLITEWYWFFEERLKIFCSTPIIKHHQGTSFYFAATGDELGSKVERVVRHALATDQLEWTATDRVKPCQKTTRPTHA